MDRLTRRDFLRVTTVAAAGVMAAACAKATPEVIEKEVTREVIKEVPKEVTKEVIKEVTKEVAKEVTKIVEKTTVVEKQVTPTPAPLAEAPQLRGLVSAGKIPPLAERLPQNPKIRDALGAKDGVQKGEIGQYGGTLYQVESGVGQFWDCWHSREMYMLHPNNTCSAVFPEVAESYEFSADKKELTFKLRKGMKWSDGAPYTVDDIIFWWEDTQNNTDLSPQGPYGWWKVAGEWTKFVKVDDFTVKLQFPQPYGPALSLASNWQTLWNLFGPPAHYVKQWHIKYNKDAAALAKSEGFDTWANAYSAHANPFWGHSDANTPEQGPWHCKEITTTYEIFDRNPFCFEVDAKGNQLPYIDQIYVYILGTQELMTAKAVSGEVSFYNAMALLKDMPVFKENEKKGDFTTNEWKVAEAENTQFAFNLTSKDPVLRKIFREVKFRQAMSLAIKRQEINDKVYFGKGMIIQSTVSPDCSYYKKEWGDAFIAYDTAKANALLDEMGLKWDAAKKWRLRPDGKTLAVVLQYNREMIQEVFELIKEYWEAVGVKVELRAIERSLHWERGRANELDVGSWSSDRMEEIRCYMPRSTKFEPDSELAFAVPWILWIESSGKTGEEPPQEWKDQYKLLDKWYTATSDKDYKDLAQQVWQFYMDRLVCIGTIGYPPQPAVVKNKLMNVPKFAYRGDGANHLKTSWPQIWWWKA